MEHHSILILDKSGQPFRWASTQEAVVYHAKDLIVWDLGDNSFTLMGGTSRATGQRSSVTVKSIIAVDNSAEALYKKFVPTVSRKQVFYRDRDTCVYCAKTFHNHKDLSLDHIIPKSRGGQNTWTNLITACKRCNSKKDDKTPEEAGLKLHFIPYVPSRWESFILANRKILADQMEFLAAGLPSHSRLLC